MIASISFLVDITSRIILIAFFVVLSGLLVVPIAAGVGTLIAMALLLFPSPEFWHSLASPAASFSRVVSAILLIGVPIFAFGALLAAPAGFVALPALFFGTMAVHLSRAWSSLLYASMGALIGVLCVLPYYNIRSILFDFSSSPNFLLLAPALGGAVAGLLYCRIAPTLYAWLKGPSE